LALLLLPERLVNDMQLRHVLADPLGARIGPGDALVVIRVLDEALPVPHQAADVELVVQDAGAAPPVAVDRGLPPGLVRRAGNALPVERMAIAFGDAPAA
jgi:hypothetical protein